MKDRIIGAWTLSFGLFLTLFAFAGLLLCWIAPHNALDPYETVWSAMFMMAVGTTTASFGFGMMLPGGLSGGEEGK
jgi:hypothetical protein